ncbi:ZYRO0B01584p [Zygosaccharomyces rouxii]|uniref:ZYRO0B01584p n=1 Tax=Zygosaccharomyces rouxii (strain ATCC 2623 / CBS 732 / NBRC 1130 / NCYC 568 / NRRL Y-229) TaxID=559307 RepID=C5DQM8_ZYGRC|nr:uncharacterized protein ZYRO0B01584g [Zygosaccharomyces rouxii]CAR26089.1 ZYRO0B01584p [Zygosaccharomyces rouxii]
MESSFDDQYSFCRSCLAVDEQNLDDANNCLCVQCALSALESSCYKQYCARSKDSQKELLLINRLIQKFNSDIKSDYEFDSDVKLSEVNYFVDPSSKVYRNLLPQEKKVLVDAVVNELRQNGNTGNNAKAEELEAFGLWRKKRTSTLPPPTPPPKKVPRTDRFPIPKPVPVPGDDRDYYDEDRDGYGYDDDRGGYDDNDDDDEPRRPKPRPKPKYKPKPPLMYTKTKVYTTYKPKKKTLTKWNPRIISKTIVIDRCSDKRTTTTVLATETDTDYETIYKPIYKVITTTDYDTVWWGTTKTKVKHDVKTKTETDYEVFTKTKYKNDLVTKTETEVEETTRYIKVGKVTVTDIETEWDVKWKTKTKTKTLCDYPPATKTKTDYETETTTDYATKTKTDYATKTTTDLTTKTRTKFSIITNHDRTRTKIKTKTRTRTKKIWNPRHTTTISASARALAFGHEYEFEDEVEKKGFGMLNIPDDPAPLLASKRVVRNYHANGSNFTTTTIGGFNSSNHAKGKPKITGISNGTNATSGAIIGVSGAPQATTAMIVYTTLVVSVATSMMLAFSYHTNLNLTNNGSEDSMDRSSSDGENNDWSDADAVELTNDETRSLADQVPNSGLLPDEMARKLSGDNSINLLVD